MIVGDKRRTGYGRIGDETDGPMRDVACVNCGTPLQVTTFVWELAKLASSALTNRGEVPLGNDEITRCKPCGLDWGERTRAKELELEAAIGRLYTAAKLTGAYPSEGRKWLLAHGLFRDVHELDARCKRFNEPGNKPNGRKKRDL